MWAYSPKSPARLTRATQEIDERIQAAYILHALYASYAIDMNPFHCALLQVFAREREIAMRYGDNLPYPNEQLVWVLWKILKGQGKDVSRNSYRNSIR